MTVTMLHVCKRCFAYVQPESRYQYCDYCCGVIEICYRLTIPQYEEMRQFKLTVLQYHAYLAHMTRTGNNGTP